MIGYGFRPEISTRHRLGFCDVGAAVKRFRYLRDGLFLAASTCYGLNRWCFKPLLPSHFLRGQFNDLLLIPAALPLILWIQRKANLRKQDEAPTWSEIFLHLVVWSVICEFIGPVFFHRGTADPLDLIAYTVGGIASGVWWNRVTRTHSQGR